MFARRPSRELGLTIVEVLVALTLLAVVILPVIVGFSEALVSTSASSIAAAAASIGREEIEELKSVDFSAVDSQPREPSDFNAGDSFFEVSVSVETVRPDDAAHSGLKKAEVAVYRAGFTSPEALITTYLTPFGI